MAENEKLSIRSDGIYSEVHYKNVQRIIETKDYLLLFIARAQFIYIPKNAFVDSGELEKFRKLIKNEI